MRFLHAFFGVLLVVAMLLAGTLLMHDAVLGLRVSRVPGFFTRRAPRLVVSTALLGLLLLYLVTAARRERTRLSRAARRLTRRSASIVSMGVTPLMAWTSGVWRAALMATAR